LMRKATAFVHKSCWKNKFFDLSDWKINLNNCNYAGDLLRKKLREQGVDLATPDINPPQEAEFILFYDRPKVNVSRLKGRKYLLMLESSLIRPDNWSGHEDYDKIFTWDDNLVDGKRYIKFNYSLGPFPAGEKFRWEEKKLCTMVCSNKFKAHPQELYTERLNAIRWFEQFHPDEFDFYGSGWDRKRFKGILRPFNRCPPVGRLMADAHPCYRGRAKRLDILSRYKFAFSYENIRGARGYITEKIIACFLAGCIPIYWGAPNIDQYIPEPLFIDRGRFASYEQLYDFLKKMPAQEHQSRLEAIDQFLKSDRFYPFTPEGVVETLIRHIL
ncbi:MAG TPA: glycosyltransferase family 10, partial [Candidatus Bathyarchaeia archaeon]|nr:glycosyltransferase family 10 [Candidatus Bathyarchaeia archaeon]